MIYKQLLIVLVVFSLPASLHSQYHPKHEMRAVWIASVSNIDWPSAPGLPVEEQKKELAGLLDMALSYNLNTVVLQIRPAADAFYPSALEPWSQWLTGTQGKAPDPLYDPLEYAISECRTRGLDVHVWLNPYRAITDTSNTTALNHITKLHPEWFVTYGRTVYFDPGLPETRNFVASVTGDIVKRYDIDAIHMDDYFYPYRIAGQEFPDDSSFSRYGSEYQYDKRDEWRRENVNKIIRQISDTIKSIKPWVEFGISPFGVWRNIAKDSTGSNTRAGQTNYDDLFADILLWQRNGWIDYITPQIYWHIGFDLADYSVLADWWARNAYGCNLYIGQAPYRIDKKSPTREWRSSKEIIRQISLNRSMPEISGTMFFSARVLRNNPLRLYERLKRDQYKYLSLTPENNRITPQFVMAPADAVFNKSNGFIEFNWSASDSAKNYVIYRFRKGKPADINDPANILHVTSTTGFRYSPAGKQALKDIYTFYITARSRTNAESEPVRFSNHE